VIKALFHPAGPMPLLARRPLPLALAAGLWLGLNALPAQAGNGSSGRSGRLPAASSRSAARLTPLASSTAASTSPSLGEASTPSTAAQLSLVDHLLSRGVVFYGAFWCQYCFRQKILFGREAGNRLPYVECGKDEAGARACSAAGVQAFPTWVMGSERRVGLQTLEQLAAWTGYRGPGGFSTSKAGN